MRAMIHAIREVPGEDRELAAALGQIVTAVCGYTWIPTKFGDDCDGLPYCLSCHPEKRKVPTSRGPRFTDKKNHPHYVYRCYDATGRLLYVGCTNNPIKRLGTHRKKAWWGDQVTTVRLLVFPNRAYALSKEREAIATEMPRWNVKGKWPHREGWALEDYNDFHHAIVQAIETTHGVYGVHTNQLLADVAAEVRATFGVTLFNRRPA